MPEDDDTPSTAVAPKRGGIHSVYGLYIGGSELDHEYKTVARYAYASQRRNVNTISSIERDLVLAHDSTTSIKFEGKLEAITSSATEIGKERFLTILERRVEEHGQETFYYMKDLHGTVVNLFEHVHNFTLEAVVNEFNARSHATNVTHAAFDAYESDEVMLSRLVVESLLTSAFYEKISIRYGHRKDFKPLPGSCLLVMALETCNASVSHDIDGAAAKFAALTLKTYPGENVSDFSNEALRLIKIMQGGYALPVNTGSRLLQKVTGTACEEFNRKIFNLLDYVKTMEHKYKVLDPRSLLLDSECHKYGPMGLILTLHEIYGRLISDHDWPALATKLPQSNNAPARTGTDRKCYRCQGPHLIKDCPLKGKSHDKDKDKDESSDKKQKPKDTDAAPAAKKAKGDLPAWRYLEPKDLTKPLDDGDGRSWKFCTKCVCKKSGKTGMYLLSHFDSEHQDDYSPPSEGNMASVDVPPGIPAVTTVAPDVLFDDDTIEFQGAWCSEVSAVDHACAFAPSPVERENDSSLVERETNTASESTDDDEEVHGHEEGIADEYKGYANAWMIPKTLSLWVLMAQLPSLIYIHFPNRRQSFRFPLETCFGVFGRPFGASGRQLLQSFLASVVLLTMHLRRCSLLGIGTISWARCFNHLRVGSFSYSPFLGFGSPCCSGKVLRTFFI